MKSFVLKAPRRLEAADIPLPEPGPSELRVKIAYVGICGSDVEAYQGRRQAEFLNDPPILGHEACGIIDKVGKQVGGLRVGDRVAVATWGCFTESVVCRPENLLKLPPEVPLIDGSLVESLPGIMMTVTRCGITRAHNVVIVGQGLSGLRLTRLVALHGSRRLIAIDLFDEKLNLAREFGATHAINAANQDVRKRIAEIAPDGVDVTIMATLDGNDVLPAIEWSRFGGRIVLYGSIGPCDRIDFFRVHCKALSIIKETTELNGLLERRRLWREATQLVADGLLNFERLRTDIFPLEELPAAMELRSTPKPNVIHVLIEADWARSRRLSGEQL